MRKDPIRLCEAAVYEYFLMAKLWQFGVLQSFMEHKVCIKPEKLFAARISFKLGDCLSLSFWNT